MEKNWVKIFTSTDYFRSEMMRQALAGNHIDSVLLSKQDSSYRNFGAIEVYVHESDFEDALEVIIRNQIDL